MLRNVYHVLTQVPSSFLHTIMILCAPQINCRLHVQLRMHEPVYRRFLENSPARQPNELCHFFGTGLLPEVVVVDDVFRQHAVAIIYRKLLPTTLDFSTAALSAVSRESVLKWRWVTSS